MRGMGRGDRRGVRHAGVAKIEDIPYIRSENIQRGRDPSQA
jgi:hypothetical protein